MRSISRKKNRAVALGDKDLPSVSFENEGMHLARCTLPYSLYANLKFRCSIRRLLSDPIENRQTRTLLRKSDTAGCIFPPSAKYAAYYKAAGLFVVFDRHEDAFIRPTADNPYPL